MKALKIGTEKYKVEFLQRTDAATGRTVTRCYLFNTGTAENFPVASGVTLLGAKDKPNTAKAYKIAFARAIGSEKKQGSRPAAFTREQRSTAWAQYHGSKKK